MNCLPKSRGRAWQVVVSLLAGAFCGSLAAAPPLPDFVIESVTLAPTNAVEGLPLSATIVVKNQGVVAGDGRFLDLWYSAPATKPVFGDVGDWWTPIGRMEPGGTRSIVAPPYYLRHEGTNRFCAVVDFENLVSESCKTNNHRCEAVYRRSLLLPIHRFWSPVFAGHFFTINEIEKNSILEHLSSYWTYEGVAFYTFPTAQEGTVPVHRFWSPVFAGHFFTVNDTEKSNILNRLSDYWTYEGVAYYAYQNNVSGAVPVHRFWSPVFSHHFFTINETEKEKVITQLSAFWIYEGVAYYACPSLPPD